MALTASITEYTTSDDDHENCYVIRKYGVRFSNEENNNEPYQETWIVLSNPCSDNSNLLLKDGSWISARHFNEGTTPCDFCAFECYEEALSFLDETIEKKKSYERALRF